MKNFFEWLWITVIIIFICAAVVGGIIFEYAKVMALFKYLRS